MADNGRRYGLAVRLLVFLAVMFSVMAFVSEARSQKEITDRLGIESPPPVPDFADEKFPDGAQLSGLSEFEELSLKFIKHFDKELGGKLLREMAKLPTEKERLNYILRQQQQFTGRLILSADALKSGVGSEKFVRLQIGISQLLHRFSSWLVSRYLKSLSPIPGEDAGLRFKEVEKVTSDYASLYKKWISTLNNALGLDDKQKEEAKKLGDGNALRIRVSPGGKISGRHGGEVKEITIGGSRNSVKR